MIIECKNCSTKFVVNDNAISANGRTVQCSNCSVQWLQLPISSTPDTIESEEVVAPSPEEKEIDTPSLEKEEKIKFSTKEAIKASDGITYKSVIENLNILDHDYYFKITTSILEKDISNTLLIFNSIIDNGFDGHHFIGGLATHFRDLLVSKDEETLVLL